ncbi:hypothetical protein GT034_32155, partial [Streptomyces sp. SID2563]|nr:hypothetical protein [Streptomyces sp. SID2563]
QLGAQLLRPERVERGAEGAQGGADPAGGAAQRGGGLFGGARSGVRGGGVLAVQAQAAQEVGGLGAQIGAEDRPRAHAGDAGRVGRGRGLGVLVRASHAGASGRQ